MKITLKTETPLGLTTINSLRDLFKVWYGDVLISCEIEEDMIKDKRYKPEPPEICQQCKWCTNTQCWFEDQYHPDFDGDWENCFTPKDESIDRESIISEYYNKLLKEEQNVRME